MQAREKKERYIIPKAAVQSWLPESGNCASERRKTATTGMEPSPHPFQVQSPRSTMKRELLQAGRAIEEKDKAKQLPVM
jgi:hypothetical protein